MGRYDVKFYEPELEKSIILLVIYYARKWTEIDEFLVILDFLTI